MPARKKKMTLVEMMIVIAIAGIFFSVMMPNVERAKRQAQAQRQAPAMQTTSGEGQFNTIEVSETSKPREKRNPLRWIGVLIGLAPIIIAAVVIATIFKRIRQQMTGHA